MTQRVLITGGSGFLGYHIINAAVKKNFEVFAAVRKSSNTEHLKGLPVQFVQLDYESESSLKQVLEENKIDYIIHSAGVTKANTEEEYNHINAAYTINLAKAAAGLNGQVKKMVLISSLAAIGPLETTEGVITEEKPPMPVTAYGRSKLKAETGLAGTNIPFAVLRPTAIYGPRDKDLYLIASSLSKGIDAYIGNIPQQLSFVHAADVAVASVNALEKGNGFYNITDGNVYNRYAFADTIKRLLNKKALRLHIPLVIVKPALFFVEAISRMKKKAPVVSREKLNELNAKNWICDISKAKRELNFSPAYNLQGGLKDTIDWYKENKWL